jgi:hypothetical protein
MSEATRTPPPWWEKRGNTSWVSCPRCRGWFPAAEALLAQADAAPHCPHCHAEFAPAAATIARP